MIAKKSISRIFSVLFVIVFILVVTPLHAVHAAGECYVKWNAGGTNSGTSWTNAYTDLQSALGTSPCAEIWVMSGTYKPTTLGTDRSATFQLKNGVALYGGFAGTETARTDRNPVSNVTILSGDIDNNDTQTPIITNLATVTGITTNSYHVVTGATGATLDGFTITAGIANTGLSGGGMYNNASSPTLTNVTFSGNYAEYGGGGMANYYSSSPDLNNVTFSGNKANWYGGGMLNFSSSPILTNVTFSGNNAYASSGRGGGMSNYDSSPTLTNVTFSSNSTYGCGGGMDNHDDIGNSNPTLTNVTFRGNSAAYGGGICNQFYKLTIRNTIIWGNTSTDGPQFYSASTDLPVSYSVIEGGYVGGTNLGGKGFLELKTGQIKVY